MNRIRRLIEVLRTRSDVGVVEQDQSWLIVITKGRDLICEVTVPHDVLEWFACVKRRRENKEIWTDWMDYTGYNDSQKEKIEAEMADDILAFVDRVSASEPLRPLESWKPRH